MVNLMIGFLILRFLCVAYGICAGRNFNHQVHLIQFCKANGRGAFMRYLFIRREE